ncbi:hypothetical protein [Wolbachia endosymbiont (group A) of Bibio marci]|nr:hypothetical protein [Wolbachia endosymbiont (group A) of Bibio marci]
MQEFHNDLPNFSSNYLSDATPFSLSIFAEAIQLERVGEWL